MIQRLNHPLRLSHHRSAQWTRMTSYLLALGLGLSACTAAQPAPEDLPVETTTGVPSATQSAAAPALLANPQLSDGETGCRLKLSEVSEDRGRPGPAYLVTDEALFRFDESGTERIEVPGPMSRWGSFAKPNGELLFQSGGAIFYVGPTDRKARRWALRQPDPESGILKRDGGDIWAFNDKVLAHYDYPWSTWRTEQIFGGSVPPRVRMTPSGELFAVVGREVWTTDLTSGVPVPTALEPSPRPFDRLFTTERQLVGEFVGGHCVLSDSWRCVHDRESRGWIVGVGPSGMMVRSDGALSAVGDNTCVIEPKSLSDSSYRLGFDGRDRLWVTVQNGFRVFDQQGAILAEYRAGMLPGIDGPVTDIIIPGGGPSAFPAPKERRTMDVIGRLTRHTHPKVLKGAAIKVHIGAGVWRTATSDQNGAFRLGDVPEGDYRVTVTPKASQPGCHYEDIGSFEFGTAHDCATSKNGERACDLGLVLQCDPRGYSEKLERITGWRAVHPIQGIRSCVTERRLVEPCDDQGLCPCEKED